MYIAFHHGLKLSTFVFCLPCCISMFRFSWAFPGGVDFSISRIRPSQKQGRDCRSWTPEFGSQLEQLELAHQVVQLAHIIHITAITMSHSIATDFLPARSIPTLWEESIAEGFAATWRRWCSTRCIWKCSSFFVSHSVHVLFKCICPVLCHVPKDSLDSGIHILASDICASTEGDEKDVRVLQPIRNWSCVQPTQYSSILYILRWELGANMRIRKTQTSGLHKLPSLLAKFLPNSSGFHRLVRQFEKYHWNLEPVRVRPQENILEISWSHVVETCWSMLKIVWVRIDIVSLHFFASWYVLRYVLIRYGAVWMTWFGQVWHLETLETWETWETSQT